MASTIWKFQLNNDGKVHMPIGAELLHPRKQGRRIHIWAIVNTENKTEERIFEVFETGKTIENIENYKYFGTTTLNSGYKVTHIFEKIK
jgi:hypothetical protein